MALDECGLLWDDSPPEKVRDDRKLPSVLPPIPDTGWRHPESFPDLSSAGMIAIDIETYDPELLTKGPGTRRDGYILGVAVGTDTGYRQYFPIAHDTGNLPKEKVYGWLSEQLSRPNQPKVGANIIYDLEYLTLAGVKMVGPFYDVQYAEPLIDENLMSYALEVLSQKYLGKGKEIDVIADWLTRAFGSSENWKNFIYKCPPQIVGPYAEGDVDRPLRILQKQLPILEAQNLRRLFEMESALIPMLLAMRLRGVRVDLQKAEALSKDLARNYEDALQVLKHKMGFQVDVWSGASMQKCFDQLGLEYPKTAKGAPSFRKTFLEHHTHWFPQAVTAARKMQKMKSTFVDGYILEGNIDGRIYSQFHPLRSDEGGTVSGRFSSSNPNLQNIPKRDKVYGPLLRALFIPEDGCRWWKYDYSQIEYRLIVHYASLRKLRGADRAVAAYVNDRSTDFHQVVANICGIERGDAKNVNFGIAYGQGIKLLCYNLGVSEEEGRRILEQHHVGAPFIRDLSDQVITAVNNRGYVITLLDRRRRWELWEDREGKLYPEYAKGRRRAMTHKALNALIQGSAADVMKKAMVDLWESGILDEIGVPHLTVHDELDGSFEPQHEGLLKEVGHIMENCVKLHVPMIAELEIGDSWKT